MLALFRTMLCFSAFQFAMHNTEERAKGLSGTNFDRTNLAGAGVVLATPGVVRRPPSSTSSLTTSVTTQAVRASSDGAPPQVSSIQALRVALQDHDIPDEPANIIIQSWRTSTLTQYASYLRRWFEFCRERQGNPFDPHINTSCYWFPSSALFSWFGI